MSIIDGILIALLFISAVIGVIVILINVDIIALKNSQQVKMFYSALIIILLVFLLGLMVKIFTSQDGQKWLDSFSDNGDCDKIDRPYWCDL